MLASGASKRNRQVTLAFPDVVRNQVDQQFGNALDKLARLRKRPDVLGDSGMPPRKRPELWYKVRIGKEAHVEHKVGIFRNTLTKAKADARDQYVLLTISALKALRQQGTQFVHVKLGGIDDQVGQVSHRLQSTALVTEGSFDRLLATQGMGATCLAIPPKQNVVGGFQKKHRGLH